MSDSVPPAATTPKVEIDALTVCFGQSCVARDVTLDIPEHSVHAWIGPAGSGKTSLLRTINLLSIEVDRAKVTGDIRLDGKSVLDGKIERSDVRRKIGMVFAAPQPLPRSIYENLVFGPKLAGKRNKAELDQLVESSLKSAQLWDEVKDRLHRSALALSGGQQQRLCIARTIALDPEVILLDEPCSGLDPISTLKIEEMMQSLKDHFTWVIVTNNTKQAARVGDRTAFFLLGELVEEGPTETVFTSPSDTRTGEYIEGRFG